MSKHMTKEETRDMLAKRYPASADVMLRCADRASGKPMQCGRWEIRKDGDGYDVTDKSE